MQVVGTSPDGTLVEVIEVPDHPWFVGVQYHPEFKSQPTRPHPLFAGFIGAAVAHRVAQEEGAGVRRRKKEGGRSKEEEVRRKDADRARF